MSDLIKREDAMAIAFKSPFFSNALMEEFKTIPTIDAVEVVRCSECEWNDGKGHCKLRYGSLGVFDDVSCDDYCSYGERKESE